MARTITLVFLGAVILALLGVSELASRQRIGDAMPIDSQPKRVHTAGYLLGYHGAKLSGAQLRQIAPLFDIVELDAPHIAVFKEANPRGKVMIYEDPHRIIHPDHIEAYLSENNYAHCNGARLEGTYSGRRMNQVDVRDPANAGNVARELDYRRYPSQLMVHWDYWLADDTSAPTGFQCKPDGYTDAEWVKADAKYLDMAAALANVPVIYNGAGRDTGGVFFSDYLGERKHVAGGMAEDCAAHLQNGNPDGPYIDDAGSVYPLWTNVQRAVLRFQHYRPKQIFICYNNDIESAQSASNNYASDIRTYVLASFLMFYDRQTSYLWELFGTASTVTVEPESGLVPLNPLRPTPRSASASDVADFRCGGAYCREYNNCYYNGTLIGYCAVEINPTRGPTVSASFPSRRIYTRAMTLRGAGMLTAAGSMPTDDGRVFFTGVPPRSLCSPGITPHASITGCVTAAIVFGPKPSARHIHPHKAKPQKSKSNKTKHKRIH